MKTEEKNERRDILEEGKRRGCVTVRYPVFDEEYTRINRFYEKLASSYIRFAEKNTAKMRRQLRTEIMISYVFFCKLTYSDESLLSVKCEARVYCGNERMSTKCFSNVWRLPKCTLAYKRSYGIRRSNVGCNGKEIFLFD